MNVRISLRLALPAIAQGTFDHPVVTSLLTQETTVLGDDAVLDPVLLALASATGLPEETRETLFGLTCARPERADQACPADAAGASGEL